MRLAACVSDASTGEDRSRGDFTTSARFDCTFSSAFCRATLILQISQTCKPANFASLKNYGSGGGPSGRKGLRPAEPERNSRTSVDVQAAMSQYWLCFKWFWLRFMTLSEQARKSKGPSRFDLHKAEFGDKVMHRIRIDCTVVSCTGTACPTMLSPSLRRSTRPELARPRSLSKVRSAFDSKVLDRVRIDCRLFFAS